MSKVLPADQHVRNSDDLKMELLEQIEALRSSCRSYDTGHLWEAKRIASVLYILLNDGSNSQSLLTQLKIKRNFQYLSTASLVTKDIPVTLVLVRKGTWGASFVPMCDDAGKWSFYHYLSFHHWWHEPIFYIGKDKSFRRRDLVIAFRNKDGGAHYDRRIDNDFAAVRTHDGAAMFNGILNILSVEERDKLGKMETVPNAHKAAMRQIAWELEFSLFRVGLIENGPVFHT